MRLAFATPRASPIKSPSDAGIAFREATSAFFRRLCSGGCDAVQIDQLKPLPGNTVMQRGPSGLTDIKLGATIGAELVGS
jgi:hypothetical protein